MSSTHDIVGPDIVFYGCIFSTDCSSASTIVVESINKFIQINKSTLYGHQWFISTPIEKGSISIVNSNIRTVNCDSGIYLRYYDNSIASCSFNATSLYPFHSNVIIDNSTSTNCQDSAIEAQSSPLTFTGMSVL